MKKILLLLAVALASSQAFAKVETKVETSSDENGEVVTTTTIDSKEVIAAKPGEHWYLSFGAGVQSYMGDNDWKANFIDYFTAPAVEIYAGKWFTPVWGFHFGMNGYRVSGLGVNSAYYNTEKTYTGSDGKRYWAQNCYDIGMFVIGDCNLINLFGGNRLKSVYDLTAGIGAGYLLGFAPEYFVHSPMVCFELNNQFNITKHFGMYLKLAGNMVCDQFDGEGGCLSDRNGSTTYIRNTPIDALFSATIGATFAFGGREWNAASKSVSVCKNDKALAASAAALAASTAALADSQREKEQLEKDLQKMKETYDATQIKDMKVWYHVQFVINKTNVTDRERVNLGAVAGFIKAQPDRKFNLTGCADKQTASSKHNAMLAEKRVEAVKAVLVNEFGVNPNQLNVESKGGVDLMFYGDNALSRCVIISSVE